MLTLESLEWGDIGRLLYEVDLARAQALMPSVTERSCVGNLLRAAVRDGLYYTAMAEVTVHGIVSRCSCELGGDCEHVAAVLLAWVEDPFSFSRAKDGSPGLIMPGASWGPVGPAAVDEQALSVIPVPPRPSHHPKKMPSWMRTTRAERRRVAGEQAEEWLAGLRMSDLRNMASMRGWSLRSTTKDALVQQATDALGDPESIGRALDRLDREQRQVLCALLLLGDEAARSADLERVARSWGELRGRSLATEYSYALRLAGLSMPASYGHGSWRQVDVVPPVVASVLPPLLRDLLLPAGEALSLLPGGAGVDLRLADPYGFVRTLHQVGLALEDPPAPLRPPMPRPALESRLPALQHWDYIADEVLALQKAGPPLSYADVTLTVPPRSRTLTDADVQRLSPLAGGEARLEFIYSLLVASGLELPGSPVTAWPEVRVQFLQRDEMAQRAILARCYVGMTRWSELWEVLREHPELQLKHRLGSNLPPDHLANHLVRFRQMVLRTLACLPDHEWVPWGAVKRLLRLVWPRFDQLALHSFGLPGQAGAWFLTRRADGQPLDPESEEDWDLAQGEMARWVISGPLHWLGFADLLLEGGRLAALRLHGWADLYWDREDAPAAPPHARALAEAEGPRVRAAGCSIAVLPSRVGVEGHNLLEKIARLSSVGAEGFVYELDAETAFRSFESGLALKQVLEEFPRLLGVPMADAMRQQLERWWDSYGRVRIYEGLTVLEFADDYTLAEIKAVTSLSDHLVAEISPRLVIIEPETVALLTQELRRAGYTPKQTDQV